jgi:hypothetical protein
MWEIVIGFMVLCGLIWFVLSRRTRTVRRVSTDRARHEATRVPVTGKCACGMPRCRYKGKQHPPATMDEAPLRNTRHHRGHLGGRRR